MSYKVSNYSDRWKLVKSNYDSAFAIKNDGSLWAWGNNSMGQLGQSFTSSFNIVKIISVASGNWQKISVGDGFSLAIKSNGTLWAWGRNADGELGQGNKTNYSSPVQIGTSFWTSISAGQYRQSLAIRSDGTLWAWGYNSSGQLGQGDTIHRSSPVQVGTSSWSYVFSGQYHSLAIKPDGTLWSWGYNGNGQLGQGDTIHRSSPVQIGGSWSSVSAGPNYSVAIRNNGTVWSWGNNFNGYLGQNDTIHRSSPVQVGTSSWSFINSSLKNTALIRTDGTLWIWGKNQYGQLGQGDTIHRSSPVQVGTSSWTSVAMNSDSTAAIKSDGTLWAWGRNEQGQLGQGDFVHKSSPVQIGTSSWTSVSANGQTVMVIRTDGTLYGFGSNFNGKLAGGAVLYDYSSPVQIGTSSWSFVSMGNFSSCAIKPDGTLWAWGLNYGQLGQGDLVHRSSPVQIGTSSWSFVSMGKFSSCAIKPDGTLWAWGRNYGQLGQGDLVHRSSPVQIGTSSWSFVSTANFSSCGIKPDGTLWAWGINTHGQLGQNDRVHRSSPVQVGTTWSRISAGGYFTLAVKSDGSLWSWGANYYGQLGLGNALRINSPVQVGTLSWSFVSAGYRSSFAIRSNGTLWAWGSNFWGQLGQTDKIHRSSPVQIGAGTNWSTIASSNISSDKVAAIKTDGSLWTWGFNLSGELGQGDTNHRSSPVQIGTSSWSMVSVGYELMEAIRSDGTLWAWGSNYHGELAQGDRTDRSSPVQIGTSSWSMVGVGYRQMYGIKLDGTLWAWGANFNGQLGQGDKINRSSPVQIGTLSWSFIDCSGFGSTLAIRYDKTVWAWGSNFNGQLGQGDYVVRSSPVQIGTTLWSSITVGTSHIIGQKPDLTLWGWGSNDYGELGIGPIPTGGFGTGTDTLLPKALEETTYTWKDISGAGGYNVFASEYFLAIKTDGTLWAWGNNNFGQLGLNGSNSRSSPVQVDCQEWKKVTFDFGYSTGTESMATGLKKDGTLWVWGFNDKGRLGLGYNSTELKSIQSPVLLGSIVRPGYVDERWIDISGSAAIRSDGTLWTWGKNNFGQLGLGDTIHRSSPVQVGTDTNWYKISSGYSFKLALKTDRSLWSWGYNGSGRLGLGDQFSRSSPVQVGTSSWVFINAGYANSVAIRYESTTHTNEGTLWTWGKNYNGCLGLGDTIHRSSPVQVGTSAWRNASIGSAGSINSSCAVRFDGSLWAWGNNSMGQLGQGNTTSTSLPVQVGTDNNWKNCLNSLGKSVLALKEDNTIWVWGRNIYGDLGLGDTNNRSSPVQLGSDNDWDSISSGAGEYHSLGAIKKDGTLWTWGCNSYGQLGQPSMGFFRDFVLYPTKVPTSNKYWISVSTNQTSSQAIDDKNTIWSWGENYAGGLGLGYNSAAYGNPAQTSPILSDSGLWTSVFSGSFFAHGIKDGYLWAWGGNYGDLFGILGYPYNNSYSPVLVSTDSWSKISSQETYSIGLKTNGTLWAWGANYGRLGLGDNVGRSSPVQIGTSSWIAVATCWSGSYGIKLDGTLWGWGGVVTPSSSSPVQIGADTDWAFVPFDSNGGSAQYAIKTNGTLWAWGSNSFNDAGRLGLGDTIDRVSPTQIGTDTNWAYVTNGYYDTLALKTDGTMWNWGPAVPFGYVVTGRGDLVDRSSPVQIGAPYSWTIISQGGYHSHAIRSDGTLWAWGANHYGQVGDGLLEVDRNTYGIQEQDRSSPVQIGTSSWIYVSAGGYSSYGIKLDGTLWSWGENVSGELAGWPLIYEQTIPSKVDGNYKIFSKGTGSSFAIDINGVLLSTGDNAYASGVLGQGDLVDRVSFKPISKSKQLESFISDDGSFNNYKGDVQTKIITYDINEYKTSDSGLINCSNGNYFILNVGLTYSEYNFVAPHVELVNVPENFYSCIFKLYNYQSGTNSMDPFSQSNNVIWINYQPQATPGVNFVYLTTYNGGATWYGKTLISSAF